MRDYKKLIAAGNKAQIEKLKENEHKKGFDDIDIMYAFGRADEELQELCEELYDVHTMYGVRSLYPKEDIDYCNARHEAADIANFAHMIILKCDELLKNS